MKFIEIDISSAHVCLFKPTRLIGIFDFIKENIIENNQINIIFIINSNQKAMFPQLSELQSKELQVMEKNTLLLAATEGIYQCEVQHLDTSVDTPNDIPTQYLDITVKIIICLFSFFCIFSIIFGFTVLNNTAVGFAFSFGGGLLLYELYLLLKVYLISRT